MDKKLLYGEIAEAIRLEIAEGKLGPGDRLPSVREMTRRWHCTPGTVQHAYQELANHGLAVSRAGQGTHVVAGLSPGAGAPLRRATLVHEAEEFLLGTLTKGYSPEDVEEALRMALDRWRAVSQEKAQPPGEVLRFVGSHDPAVALMASRPAAIAGYTMELKFTGSLGGLIALVRGEADMAGAHLLDEETGDYNTPFVRRLLPGKKVALLTLHHRNLGLMVAPGNPRNISGLRDLDRPGIQFVNRQEGSGTRVWLDAQMRALGISPASIQGFKDPLRTHTEVAQAIAEGRADVGLGIEASARAYRLGFIALAKERYDIVVTDAAWGYPAIQAIHRWLMTQEAKDTITGLGGYDTHETGLVNWVP